MLAYSVHTVTNRKPGGITQPVYGSMRAVLKSDGPEIQHCVYNELVAVRLAQVLQLPVLEGVLAGDPPDYRFASLVLSSPAGLLPNVAVSRFGQVAKTYPTEASALLSFDLLIGNWDRAQNLKASMVSPHIRFFGGFDHSHSLLAVANTALDSIARLEVGELIVRHHPFFGRMARAAVLPWLKHIAAVPAAAIRHACVLGERLNGIDLDLQKRLAKALVVRASMLGALVRRHSRAIGLQ